MNETDEITGFWVSVGGHWRGLLTGSVLAALLGLSSLLNAFGVSVSVAVPAWVIVSVIAATVIWAVCLAGLEQHRARLRLVERLKSKLKILDEVEVDASLQRCRIRVKSQCDIGCRFGVEITEISPVVQGMVLPFALRLIPEVEQRTGHLPARQTRAVDVVGNGK